MIYAKFNRLSKRKTRRDWTYCMRCDTDVITLGHKKCENCGRVHPRYFRRTNKKDYGIDRKETE